MSERREFRCPLVAAEARNREGRAERANGRRSRASEAEAAMEAEGRRRPPAAVSATGHAEEPPFDPAKFAVDRLHHCRQRHSRFPAVRRAGGTDEGRAAAGVDDRPRHSRLHRHGGEPVGLHRSHLHPRLRPASGGRRHCANWSRRLWASCRDGRAAPRTADVTTSEQVCWRASLWPAQVSGIPERSSEAPSRYGISKRARRAEIAATQHVEPVSGASFPIVERTVGHSRSRATSP